MFKVGDEILRADTGKRCVILCVREHDFILLSLDFDTVYISGRDCSTGKFYDLNMVPTGRSVDLKGFLLGSFGNYDETIGSERYV